MRVSRISVAVLLLLLLMMTVLVTPLFARAGGGGGRSRGSGGEGIGVLIYIMIRVLIHLPFPLNVISIAVIILIALWVMKKKRQQSVLNQLPTGKTVDKVRGYRAFKEQNPGFDKAVFTEKVKSAFLQIQEGWAGKDVSRARRWLSDGVYQRFSTQFRMMDILKQKNILEKVEVRNIYIDRIERDGLFDIMNVAIHASINDRFISEMDSSLNSGGKEEFVEYWSFLRKRGIESRDLFGGSGCPGCGAELLEGPGEVSRCEYCGTLLNSGEFDWVLSEITQADDYIGAHRKFAKTENLNNMVKGLIQENEDFSVQLVEDKASNGFLQILTAYALQDPTIMRRFVTDAAFEKLQKKMPKEKIAYNRIYLNGVSLLGVREEGNKNILMIAVRFSSQRIVFEGEKIRELEEVVVSRSRVVLMEREKGATASRGSLYMHSCPGCGAACENSLEIRCPYCGGVLNSPRHEWIISGILTMLEYDAYVAENGKDFSYKVSPRLLNKLYDVRDFALNNVMVMIAADGCFDAEEDRFAREMAHKWGFNVRQLAPMFQMAENGRLVIRMPEARKQRERIYKLMQKAAMADHTIVAEERQLLYNVKRQFLPDNEGEKEEAEEIA